MPKCGQTGYQPTASAAPDISGRLYPSTESSGLASGENSPREHRLERAIVELNDEGEHQVEQVAVLSREVEAKNVTDQRQISMRRRDRADIDMNIPASTP